MPADLLQKNTTKGSFNFSHESSSNTLVAFPHYSIENGHYGCRGLFAEFQWHQGQDLSRASPLSGQIISPGAHPSTVRDRN